MLNKNIINIGIEKFNTEQTNNGFKITGLALPFNERSRNGFLYRTESIKNNYETLIGKPVLFNHEDDKVLGHITNAYVDKDGLHYEMDIDPEETDIVRKVKRGDINKVSIQALYTNPTQSENGFDVDIQEFLELSLVTLPGFADTTAKAGEKLRREFAQKSEFVQALEDAKYFDDTAYEEDKYPWDKCIADQKKRGYSDDAANKICAAIKNRSVKHLLDKGSCNDSEEAISLIGELFNYNNSIFELKTIKGEEKMADEKPDDKKAQAPPDENTNDTNDQKQEEQDDVQKFMDLVNELKAQINALNDRISKLEGGKKEEPEEKPPEEKPEVGEKLSKTAVAGEEPPKEITVEKLKETIKELLKEYE